MISRTSIFLVAFLGFFSTVYSNVKCPGKADYVLSVYYMWSNATHPDAVPMNGTNFSPLVGCSHSSGYKMFEAGMMATEGVKNVAETGNTTKLKYEIMKQMMYNKTTWKTFEASGKVNGTAHVSGLNVYATADYYMVSAIAMMVPSPDWFVGVAGVNLCDNGMWKENETAMSQPWDAGTKNGSMFDMGNAATSPPGYITVITKESDTPFKGLTGDIKPLAKFMWRRVNKPTMPSCSGEKKYTLKFEGMWKSGVQSASFPSGAHFSPLIGCTHNYKYKFWSPMTMASPGVQSVAETGGTTTLYNEIMAVKGKPTPRIYKVYKTSAGSDPTETVTMEIMVKDKYSLVSIITMIAPSPDWFVGIDSVNLCGSNGWEKSVEISLPAWDGGSDTGLGFTSENEPTMPHDLVKLLTEPNAQAAYGKITITMMKEDDKDSGSHRPSAGIYTLLSVAFMTILRFLY